MLRLCGLCGYFERDSERPECGTCLAGHRAEHDHTTFNLGTCDHFEHKRNFKPGTIIPLLKKKMEREFNVQG